MASIKDAVEDSFHDTHSIIKYILFAIPLFLVVNFNKEQLPGYSFWVFLTVILLLGFMSYCTYNVRAGNAAVLPSFNIFSTFWAGIKGALAVVPMGLLVYFISKYIAGQIEVYIPDPNIVLVFSIIVYGVFASLAITTYILYASTLKISDAYNLKAVSAYSVDVLIAVIFMLIQAALVDTIILAPISYVLWLFFGLPHPVAIYVWSVIFIFNLAMLGHYMAQISYEVIDVKEEAKKD